MTQPPVSTEATGMLWRKVGPPWRANVEGGEWFILKAPPVRGRRRYTLMFKDPSARKWHVNRGILRLKDAKAEAAAREWRNGGRDLEGMS